MRRRERGSHSSVNGADAFVLRRLRALKGFLKGHLHAFTHNKPSFCSC